MSTQALLELAFTEELDFDGVEVADEVEPNWLQPHHGLHLVEPPAAATKVEVGPQRCQNPMCSCREEFDLAKYIRDVDSARIFRIGLPGRRSPSSTINVPDVPVLELGDE